MARKFEEKTAKPTNDAYTGMMALSFVALLIGCTFLYLQVEKYGKEEPKPLNRKKEAIEPPPKEESTKKEKEETPTTDDDKKAKDDDKKPKDDETPKDENK